MYLMARTWGIQPGEFWAMTMKEWFLEFELNQPTSGKDCFAGGLTQGDVDELAEFLEGQ